MHISKKLISNQAGFSLIEIMVGLVIGLIATLVIMNVITAFEGQKRTTTGNSDAQVNGSVAMYNIQRVVQMAGFGLPIFDATSTINTSPLRCLASLIDDDGNAATPRIDFFPIAITDGGAGLNDTITIRYFPGANGGIPATVTPAIAGQIIGVDNNLGCRNGDIILVVSGTTCNGAIVNTPALAANINPSAVVDQTHITVAGADVLAMPSGARVSCLGASAPNLPTSRQEITYRVNAGQLESQNRTANAFVPIVSGILGLQAQYGIAATSTSNQVTQWVNATGAWVAPTVANRNRIRAIRFAVIARNGLLERAAVTTACSANNTANPTGLCAWAGTAASPAPTISLANMGGANYRYRVYETIIPLRNMTWSGTLL